MSSDQTGVFGFSGPGLNPPAALADVGVFGYAIDTTNARGVYGQSTIGRGVHGQATSGRGVYGQASSGYGVRGFASSGSAVYGEATTGFAIRSMGRIRLEQSAGKATIASGTSSVVVTPGIDLTTTTAVIATLNGNAGGSVAVKRVAIDTAADTFTIFLTANSTASVSVAWLVIS